MTSPAPHAELWMLRIPEIFERFSEGLLQTLQAIPEKRLGEEYVLVRRPPTVPWETAQAMALVRWRLPLEHAWPCQPRRMEGFVEKAAQALAAKFADRAPQTILIGPLSSKDRDPYYRRLASNLRGRALQLFPPLSVPSQQVEAQDPERETLFCLVGREGLYCGMHSPRAAKGFFPGGTKFIRQHGTAVISRAGAKLAEALHHRKLHTAPPAAGSHWLELGASPGGMTSELLARQYRVTAVDRAPLDPRLSAAGNLTFSRADVAAFRPPAGTVFDAILSDLNGDPRDAFRHVARLSSFLRPGGAVIFTLKTAGADRLEQILQLHAATLDAAAEAGLRCLAGTHLTYNRLELTLFFERRGTGPSAPAVQR